MTRLTVIAFLLSCFVLTTFGQNEKNIIQHDSIRKTSKDTALHGQKKLSFTIGLGYRASTSDLFSFMLNFKPKKRIEFSIGPYWNFNIIGQGISTSARVYYLLNKKLFLNTDIAYRHLFSARISISPADHDDQVGNYYVPSSDFAYIAEGINYILSGKRDKHNVNRKLNLSVYYGIPFMKYNCEFRSGIESSEIEQQIQGRITASFGISFSFTD